MKFAFAAGLLGFVTLSSAAEVKLGVVIVVDQLSAETFQERAPKATGGIARLMREGAVFEYAEYRAAPTVTSVGHATLSTGTYGNAHGIVANNWFDATSEVSRQSTEDTAFQIVGRPAAERDATAPTSLRVSTLSTSLKSSHADAKSVVVSGKDRSAILTAGHSADVVLWFDSRAPQFVTSTYYGDSLPPFVAPINERIAAAWKTLMPNATAKDEPAETMAFQSAIDAYEVDVALAAVDSLALGKDAVTDLLSISFSGHDRIGHHYGPDSAESAAAFASVDAQLGRLMKALDERVGKGKYVVAFSSDHGVGKKPEVLKSRRVDAGRVDIAQLRARLESSLDASLGPAEWIVGYATPGFIFNRKLRSKVTPAALATLKQLAQSETGVLEILTLSEVLAARGKPDAAGAFELGAFEGRSPDLFVVPKPYWIYSKSDAAAHSTWYSYDRQVPMVFWGAGVSKAKRLTAEAIDFAPTMAWLLHVSPPASSVGRIVLSP
jgi:predicted AlkP superfamily pyrophosphatase or phosphodiesterase